LNDRPAGQTNVGNPEHVMLPGGPTTNDVIVVPAGQLIVTGVCKTTQRADVEPTGLGVMTCETGPPHGTTPTHVPRLFTVPAGHVATGGASHSPVVALKVEGAGHVGVAGTCAGTGAGLTAATNPVIASASAMAATTSLRSPPTFATLLR
jgi:hypothetical protein